MIPATIHIHISILSFNSFTRTSPSYIHRFNSFTNNLKLVKYRLIIRSLSNETASTPCYPPIRWSPGRGEKFFAPTRYPQTPGPSIIPNIMEGHLFFDLDCPSLIGNDNPEVVACHSEPFHNKTPWNDEESRRDPSALPQYDRLLLTFNERHLDVILPPLFRRGG